MQNFKIFYQGQVSRNGNASNALYQHNLQKKRRMEEIYLIWEFLDAWYNAPFIIFHPLQ